MESIVTLHSGSPVVSSTAIAEGVGRQHKPVIQLVRQNLSDFEEFGTLTFEMRVSGGHNGGGQRREVALLNEPQATLLLTYMRNNDVVRAFKKRLVRAFFEMREALAKQAEPKEPPTPAAALPSAAELVETREERAKRLTRERQHRYYIKKREKRLVARALPPPTLPALPPPSFLGDAPASDERLHRLLTDYRYRRESIDAVRKLFQLLPPRTPIPNLDVQKIADGLILEAMRHCEFRLSFGPYGEMHAACVPNAEAQRGMVHINDAKGLVGVISATELDGMKLEVVKQVVQAGIERIIRDGGCVA